jgi:hypothetical protein
MASSNGNSNSHGGFNHPAAGAGGDDDEDNGGRQNAVNVDAVLPRRLDPTTADTIITVAPTRSVVTNMAIYDVLLTSRRHVSSKDVINTPTSLSMRRMNESCYP